MRKEIMLMATKLKRFTISLTPEIEVDLDAVKKEYFYRSTQNEMIRALIIRGLSLLKDDGKDKAIKQHNSS
jgi:hypothetical protein